MVRAGAAHRRFRQSIPSAPECQRASSNDVTMDKRGLIYVTDRQRGVHVIEFAGAA
jgi:sugar lactone lactonase YvrE